MKMDAVSVGVQVCGCVCVDVYEDGCGKCGRAGVWMCVWMCGGGGDYIACHLFMFTHVAVSTPTHHTHTIARESTLRHCSGYP